MEEVLIPYIINERGEVTVSARALHEFLQIKTAFTTWVPRMVEYGFEEEEDYIPVMQKCKTAGGVQDIRDYMFSLDMAKEICMIQRSDRGRQARLYFINLEKRFNSPEAILDKLKQLLIINAENKVVDSEDLGEKLTYPSQRGRTLEPMTMDNTPSSVTTYNQSTTTQLIPKYMIDTYNSTNFSDLITNFRDTAKIFGMKENMLINWLLINGYCYRDNNGTIKPYSQHMLYFYLRPFKSPAGHSGVQTLINSQGRDYFTSLLLEEDLLESEDVKIL